MKRFKNILCVMESEDGCQSALERAMTLAENNQATVTVATVTERPGGGRNRHAGADRFRLICRQPE